MCRAIAGVGTLMLATTGFGLIAVTAGISVRSLGPGGTIMALGQISDT